MSRINITNESDEYLSFLVFTEPMLYNMMYQADFIDFILNNFDVTDRQLEVLYEDVNEELNNEL